MLGAKSSEVIAKAGFSAPQDYTGVQRDRFGNTKQDALFTKVASHSTCVCLGHIVS